MNQNSSDDFKSVSSYSLGNSTLPANSFIAAQSTAEKSMQNISNSISGRGRSKGVSKVRSLPKMGYGRGKR